MGSIYLRKIVNSEVTDIFEVNNLDNLSIAHNSPVSPMPLPEENDAENVLIKVEGNYSDINISWNVVPQNNNVAKRKVNNTWSSVATTDIWSQRQFLYEMIPIHIEESFDIIIDKDNSLTLSSSVLEDVGVSASYVRFLGTWQKINFRMSGGAPTVFNADLQFVVGNVISAYSSDVPSRPRNFVAVDSATANSIDMTFDKPANLGSASSTYPIQKYTITYTKVGTQPVTADIVTSGATADSFSVTFNVGSTGTYYVSVRSVTSQGKGDSSVPRKVVVT